MKHADSVRAEFARQARTFAASETLAAPSLTSRVGDAIRDLRSARVLDLACGPGVLVSALQQTGAVVVGVDLTSEVLRVARGREDIEPGAHFVQGAGERAPFASGVFDAVAIRLVLHHVEDPARILAEARRALRRGGRLVVLDILGSSDVEEALLHDSIERLRDPSHTAFPNEDGLVAAVADTGFSQVAVETWETSRSFPEWATIIAEPARMASLEVVLRRLCRAGVPTAMRLREEEGELRFTYRWGLLVATAGELPSSRRART